MDDLTLITLGETDPSIKPNTWPDAHIIWEPNEDRTHANGHLEWSNSEPPEPEREDITVVHATTWSAHNSYYKGQTVYCNVANFSGGSDETIYRWRLQQREGPDDGWVNSSWTNYSDHALEISVVCPEGQIRIHCQARDGSVDPVDQVNSFSVLQAVKIPSMGQPRPSIDGEAYDPNAEQPHGVREEQAIELSIDLPNNDGGQPTWSWNVRQGSARLSPNGPYCVAFNETEMGSPLGVQVDMIDNNCSDSPHSIRYTMFVTTASKKES